MLKPVATVLSVLALVGGWMFGVGAVRSVVAAAPSERSKSVTLDGVSYADHGTKDVRSLSKLSLEADDYYFSPTFLRGKPGQKLTLLIENEGHMIHNISIPAHGVDTDIPVKGKVRMEVTFPASGVLAFSCKFHEALGMNGRLMTVGVAAGHGAVTTVRYGWRSRSRPIHGRDERPPVLP